MIVRGKIGRRILPMLLAGVWLALVVTTMQSMRMASHHVFMETETSVVTTRGAAVAESSAVNPSSITTSPTVNLGRVDDPYSNSTHHETLALLFPPALLGGYRNQVLRFVAFCVHAKENGSRQLLLPSLLWSTQVTTTGTSDSDENTKSYPIPMEWIFDIEYWNEHALIKRQEPTVPLLVGDHQVYTEENPSDCWELSTNKEETLQQMLQELNVSRATLNPLQIASLQSGSLSPISNITRAAIAGVWNVPNPRRIDLLPQVQHCQRPHVYGGGKRAGRLWNEYVRFRTRAENKKNEAAAVVNNNNSSDASSPLNPASIIPYQMDQGVYQALRPAKQWRQVAQQCVQAHAPNQHYVALHARVEVEMMGHRCGTSMERNLTRIVQQVQDLIQQETETTIAAAAAAAAAANTTISGLFVAVSRSGMEVQSQAQEKFRAFADDNIATLNRLVGNETTTGTGIQINHDASIPVFECGEHILREHYASHPNVPDHGSLLQSVINFYIALNADIFVGVENSSYSTDVMTTRYYLGKGSQNYRYTMDGKVQAVENGGLPLPHSNCKPPQNAVSQ